MGGDPHAPLLAAGRLGGLAQATRRRSLPSYPRALGDACEHHTLLIRRSGWTAGSNRYQPRVRCPVLKSLRLSGVGPSEHLDAAFKPRLNIVTGDNGLGKSFLLDIAWWALTRKWPRELNRGLTSGDMARPSNGKAASIGFVVQAKTKAVQYTSKFLARDQAWTGRAGRPLNPGLVLYAMADGSFAAWDPARNYWRKRGNIDVQDRVPAYVFGPRDVWDGLRDPERGLLCNGMVADWASWQKEDGAAFKQFSSVLKAISPSEEEPIVAGGFARISIDDPRDVPTLKMPYGIDVPVIYASAGIKRITSLAYLLVWSWQEHRKACALLGEATTSNLVFLIDEIEAHLHPRWQRSVVTALLDVMNVLAPQAEVQMIVATHSPLVMASVETHFDPKRDAWFDIDLVRQERRKVPIVEFKEREFVRLGEVSNWLMSSAFDLKSARSREAEDVLEEAAQALSDDGFTAQKAHVLYGKLAAVLGDTDPFWVRWKYVGQTKGWWKDEPPRTPHRVTPARRKP